jgi:hypothetical protein
MPACRRIAARPAVAAATCILSTACWCCYFSVPATTFLNTDNHLKFNDSPQAKGQNNFNNELKLIGELIKSKEDIILSQSETITQLKEMIELLKKSKCVIIK